VAPGGGAVTGHPRAVMNHVGVACAGRMSMGPLGATRQRPSRQRGLREVMLVGAVALCLLVAAAPVSAQETVEYYGTDPLGSVRVVFDQSGSVIARADYLPFGEEVAAPGPTPAERFTGQARDGEVGLDYLHARMFSPRLGRFTTFDPATPNIGAPQQWNRYSYVSNSPLAFVDPSGLLQLQQCDFVTVTVTMHGSTGNQIGLSFYKNCVDFGQSSNTPGITGPPTGPPGNPGNPGGGDVPPAVEIRRRLG
jgi:RHS repeat-associated protein